MENPNHQNPANFPLALTYNDVLLVPQRTPLSSRSEANIESFFTKNIKLKKPFVSANMATVTEHKMAIAMARGGGLGVIHQFGTIEEEAAEVELVKRSTSYVINKPLSVSIHATIQDAVNIMRTKGVTSLLVKNGDELVGIFTSRDYLFEYDLSQKITSVMTPRQKLITAAPGISLDEAKKILHFNRIEKLPLIDNHGKVSGLITTQDIKKLENWPDATRDKNGCLRVGASVGVKDTIERAQAMISAGADAIVLDIAHAHSDLVIKRLKELKSIFEIDVMVGNIGTAAAARDLIEAGADGLKIGIGPSPVCTTRITAGAGVPQFTAVMNVAREAKKYGVPVSADGGMKLPGDAAKALAIGASSVYSGSFFAGTDEAPGMIIKKDGRNYKKYIGSASYESSHVRKETQTNSIIRKRMNAYVEGISSLVDYKGPVQDVIDWLARGVQSGLSYCGAHSIEEMQENAEFVRITPSGWTESGSRGMKLSE